MDTSSGVCRICLSVDTVLGTIADTPLQTVYENLTTLTLRTADRRPLEACCICRAELNKSCKLMLKALKAEAVLSAILDRTAQVTKQSVSMIDREALGLCGALTASSAECFDNISLARVKIKTEPIVEDAVNTEVVHKLEGPPQPAAFEILDKKSDAEGNNEFFMNLKPISVEPEMNAVEKEIGDGTISVELLSSDGEDPRVDLEAGTSVIHTSVHSSMYGEAKEPRGSATSKRYQCDICHERFRCNTQFRRHMKNHTGEKPQCSICNQTFTRQNSLKRHLKIHTGEKFVCSVCNRKYSEKRTLKSHMRTHTEKPHQCDICLQAFEQSSQLESHLGTHPGVNEKIRKKSNECHICKKTLTRNASLAKHLRTHTGEKPHECNICQRRFTDKNNLNVHYRRHTSDKPYECDFCKHRFYHKSNLNTHLRIHTLEKPYECNLCHVKFNQSGNLRTHYDKIHSRVSNIT